MSRKRSRNIKKKEEIGTKKPILKSIKEVKRKPKFWIAIALVGIFFLVLLMNGYFNYMGGESYNMKGETLGTRFFLQGPDPYYNMRTCEVMMETSSYPYLSPDNGDPLLNYPVGIKGGARPPLFNTIAVVSAKVLENFMPSMDALGWSMLFLPAIYGALLVFPVYGIGKELFNKKVGIISAFFIPLIPAHISGGHGSNLGLFDHDSFLLLLFMITFFFAIKAFKENERIKKYIYGVLAGVAIGSVQLSWAAGQTLLFLIVGYMIVQLFFDILRSKYHYENQIAMCIALGISLLISYPYFLIKQNPLPFGVFTLLVGIVIVSITLFVKYFKLPAIVIFPVSGIIGGVGVYVVYLFHIGVFKGVSVLIVLGEILFGTGIYGNKVSLTIGEAHTYGLSQIGMMIGPVVLWVGLAGFVLYMYKTHKRGYKSENLFVITMFIFELWLLSTAGRFLNDLIPLLVVFNGFIIFTIIKNMKYSNMIKTIRNVSGFKNKLKAIKPLGVFAIIFISFGLIGTNSFLALDAAIPYSLDEDIFGEDFQPYFGSSVGEQIQWADACYWLSQQDTEIENDGDKPATITWWDYGFYLASMSKHPTVADNYQEGLYTAGNFHTAQNEKEATSVLIIRLIEGTKKGVNKNDAVSKIYNPEVEVVLEKYFGNETENIINILEDPVTYAPSYNTLIAEDYGNKIFRVREHNAMYHDVTDIFTKLSDDKLTELYLDMMEATGYSIRYYGIESRDIGSIFGVFPFLSDKATHGYSTYEDDFYKTVWVDRNTGQNYEYWQLVNMTVGEKGKLDLRGKTEKKDAFYDSMIYKTYYGLSEDNRIPTYSLKHWKPEYIGLAILIAKYYAGAKVNGTVSVGITGYDGSIVYVKDEYGIIHDLDVVNDGKFDLIVPAGNISLELGMGRESLDVYNLGNVTDDEAMRKVPFNRSVDFYINTSSIEGNISGLNATSRLEFSCQTYQGLNFTKEVFNGKYSFDDMIPDYYNIKIYSGNETIYNQTKFIKPETNIYNITVVR